MVYIQNMLRAIENMGIEMSFGIIFIGNGRLSTLDFARFIEKHKLNEEYILQSSSFLSSMRQKLQGIKDSPQYKKYVAKYKYFIKEKILNKVGFQNRRFL